jgi:fructose-1,6-bisphosphatase/inositol monophosphatase family enzyme
MSHPIGTLYTAVFEALRGLGAVYADFAPQNLARPYFVFFFVSGGDTRTVLKNRQSIVLTVKCVADTLAIAVSGASSIDAIMADSGRFDGGVIVGDSAWDILTITQDGNVYLREDDEQVAPIYHVGYQYEIVMEAK